MVVIVSVSDACDGGDCEGNGVDDCEGYGGDCE